MGTSHSCEWQAGCSFQSESEVVLGEDREEQGWREREREREREIERERETSQSLVGGGKNMDRHLRLNAQTCRHTTSRQTVLHSEKKQELCTFCMGQQCNRDTEVNEGNCWPAQYTRKPLQQAYEGQGWDDGMSFYLNRNCMKKINKTGQTQLVTSEKCQKICLELSFTLGF